MSELLERTFCPYCGPMIVKEFNAEKRLFGNTIKCESRTCEREFIVSSAQVYDKGASLEGSASVREIIRIPKQNIISIDDGQRKLEEFV